MVRQRVRHLLTAMALLTPIVLLTPTVPALAEYKDRGPGGVGIGPRLGWAEDSGFGEEALTVGGVLRARNNVLGLEAAVAYRKESLSDDVELRVWPVTVSALLFPLLPVYGLAGLGWYNTTLDVPDTSAFGDETATELGYHLGAGIELPLSPQLRLASDVRWLFLEYEFEDIPESVGQVDADTLELSAALLVYF
jgi:opacity protein-like surface antigen